MHCSLVCHPASPARAVHSVSVLIERTTTSLSLCYVVDCPIEKLVLPAPQAPSRCDGLWQTTCCELFVRDDAAGYREYNFSPSSQWAAYRFAAPREGMQELEVALAPIVELADADDPTMLGVWLDLDGSRSLVASISVVIEEVDGTRSYWALAHPGERPDFHHPDCFVLELPPAIPS